MAIMIGITIVFMIMLSKGSLGLMDGLILISMLVLFLWDQFVAARKNRAEVAAELLDDVQAVQGGLGVAVALLVVGFVLLPFGAWLTVDSAQAIAISIGVPDEIIGLTIVAIGTSLPELAASLMAVLRGNSNVAIGNVVGSNIFNIAAIMGVTTVITQVEVSSIFVTFDMWIMLACALWLAWIACYPKQISKLGGMLLTGAYAAFIIISFAS